MGLDSVELVMECEDEFGVRLPDADCERVRSVADLAGLISTRLLGPCGVCHTAHTFYELRSLLTEHANIDRHHIRPGSPLAEIFPPSPRRLWIQISEHDIRLPRLRASPMYHRVLRCGGWILLSSWWVGAAAIWQTAGFWFAIVVSLSAFAFGCIVIARLAERGRRHIPAELATVGDLARAMTPLELTRNDLEERSAVRKDVLERVRRLTAQQLGIPLEKVLPGSSFVKDLGMD
ncbi:MAG: hypothetical protein H7210_06105 [Pyrinomonadaceae bacterium]|nr:hypothetical protein [Phycisphaerales bacterium]